MPANPNGPVDSPYYRGRITVLDTDIIEEGNLVMVNTSTGEAQNAVANTASRRVVGWAMERVDNTDDGESVPVSREPRLFAGKAGDLPTVIGETVYVDTALSVKKTSDGANAVTAGTLLAIINGKYAVQFA
jgi:hypothetical protein